MSAAAFPAHQEQQAPSSVLASILLRAESADLAEFLPKTDSYFSHVHENSNQDIWVTMTWI